MGFSDAVRSCMREKYFRFSGRAARSEFWWFTLFMWLVMLVAGAALGGLFFGVASNSFGNGVGIVGWLLIIIGAVVFVALQLPAIAVTVRRFHDKNLSGWWVLAVIVLSNVPFLGILVNIASLVILVMKGTEGDNRFGPDPLRVQNSAEVFA